MGVSGRFLVGDNYGFNYYDYIFQTEEMALGGKQSPQKQNAKMIYIFS